MNPGGPCSVKIHRPRMTFWRLRFTFGTISCITMHKDRYFTHWRPRTRHEDGFDHNWDFVVSLPFSPPIYQTLRMAFVMWPLDPQMVCKHCRLLPCCVSDAFGFTPVSPTHRPRAFAILMLQNVGFTEMTSRSRKCLVFQCFYRHFWNFCHATAVTVTSGVGHSSVEMLARRCWGRRQD